MRGTHKGRRVYHPGAATDTPSLIVTDSSPETITANLDDNAGDEHPSGDLLLPNDTGTGSDLDAIPSSDAPLPPSSPPPGDESVSDESVRSTGKRKRSALTPSQIRTFSLESSPADSSFSTPQNSDVGGKRARITGPVVLHGIKEELSSFRSEYSTNAKTRLDIMKDIATKKTSADYRREARSMFQRLEPNLSNQATLHIMSLLQNDKNAETYVDLIRDSLRTAWVEEQIKQAGLE